MRREEVKRSVDGLWMQFQITSEALYSRGKNKRWHQQLIRHSKTCLYFDVIEMIFLPLFEEVDVKTMIHTEKSAGEFDDNCGKTKMTANKIDFYYINGNMKLGFLYSQEQHLLERRLFGVSISFCIYYVYRKLRFILYSLFVRIRYRENKNGGYSIRRREWICSA